MRLGSFLIVLGATVLTTTTASAVEISSTQHLGREHWQVKTEAATYLFDPIAGGFSSIFDQQGNDWVAYNDPASADYPAGAAFAYRGLPNLIHGGEDGGAGHPGFAHCESRIIGDRRIHSRTLSGKWEWVWTFAEDHARLSILRADPDRAYWFLYEGPVGGRYELSTTIWGSSQSGPSQDHPDFYKNETRFEYYRWLYFCSGDSEQTFWIAQLTPDELPDLYGQLGNTPNGNDSPDGMVVTGFGRGPNTEPQLRGRNEFLIGFWPAPVKAANDHQAITRHLNQQIAQARSAQPHATWPYASPAAVGLDPTQFAAALDVLRDYSGADGLDETFIVRHGQVIYAGPEIDNRHNIYSCTKSLTSTVLGLLIADGKCTPDWEPLLAEPYPDVTLRHFTTMTSGYSAAGNSRWNEDSEDWSQTPFTPIEPYFEAGTAYAYWDEAMMMFGRVLTQIAGEDLHTYLDRKVFSRIGIGEWEWWHDAELADGTPLRNGCTGIGIDAEQLARIGLLFLNDGAWNGEQILPRSWVEQATSVQVPADLPIGETDRAQVEGNGRYGFNWWVRGNVDDMPDTPAGTYYMSGLHNNMCFVIPEWEMVIVRRGEDGNPPEGKRSVYNAFFKALSKALEDS